MGNIHIIGEIGEVWTEVDELVTPKTPSKVFPFNTAGLIGEDPEGTDGLWLTYTNRTVDFFDISTLTVTHTLTLPVGSLPTYVLDLGSSILVTDNGATPGVYIILKLDFSYTKFTDEAITSPNCLIDLGDGSGDYIIAQDSGVVVRTDLVEDVEALDTGYGDNKALAVVGQAPNDIHIIVASSTDGVIQIVRYFLGEMTVKTTIEQDNLGEFWCFDDYRMFIGDGEENLLIIDTTDLSIISTNDIGLNPISFTSAPAGLLFFVDINGVVGCWNRQTSELIFNDLAIDMMGGGIAIMYKDAPV